MCNKNSSKKNIMISIAVLIIFSIVSYFVGYKVAYDRFEQSVALNHLSYENVYAKIKDIDAQYITVDGLEMNSDEYRRELILEVYGETELIWAGAPINISELKVGQIISITLGLVDGSVNTSDNFITDIEKIQVLYDAEDQELQIGTDIVKNIVEISDVSTMDGRCKFQIRSIS